MQKMLLITRPSGNELSFFLSDKMMSKEKITLIEENELSQIIKTLLKF